VRAATTASSLEAEQDSGNITKTRSKAKLNELSSPGTSSGSGPRCQETIGDTTTQTRFGSVSKLSYDPLLTRGNALRSGVDSLKLNELMELCTNLQTRVLDLEKTKTTQANQIASLKRRVKKLEKRISSRTHKLKRLYKVGLTARVEFSRDEQSLGEDASKQGMKIDDIDVDQDITLVGHDEEMFDVGTLTGDEVFAEQGVAATDNVDEVTLAQTLMEIKSTKLKVKWIVIQEPGTTTTTTTTISSKQSQDKDKGIMVEPERPLKKKYQISFDDEVALNYKLNLMRKKDLQERDASRGARKLSDTEKATLFVELLEKRRKHFAAKKAKEKRNKPPTQAQQRKIMCTYLKDMEGKKLKDLKNKSFDSIQKMFDGAFKRVNTFVDFRIEEDLVELYKLVKAKYRSTRPVEDMYLLLWGDLKTMFEPHVEDEIWKLQQSFLNFSENSLRISEVFGSILLVIMKLSMKKLDDFGDKYQSKLVLLENFNEDYSKCLRLLEEVTTAKGSYYC
ncbi:hypothetical protein Tco_0982155, partial [Tanacetum coccineum]